MTKELQIAIDHVKSFHPTLSLIIFDRMGRWQYMDEYFNNFVFDDRINVGILEEASDSICVYPSIFDLSISDD
jgi:hypothetical protein